MKKILNILIILFVSIVFTSCVNSKYHVRVIDTTRDSVIMDTTIVSLERLSFIGEDTYFHIKTDNVNCQDTTLVIYKVTYDNTILLKYSKPIIVYGDYIKK